MAFGDFTVVRAGTKWVLNSSGVLSEVANNVPAFEFNTDGTYRGLLVEPAGTNLALRIEVGKTATPSTSLNFIFETRGTFTTQTASVLLWGAQLETGSVATSYIPTVASTANRVADSVTLTGASSLIGQIRRHDFSRSGSR
jgi:hypothetical protein